MQCVQAIAAGSQRLAQAVTEHQRHASAAAEAAATSIALLEQQVADLQVCLPTGTMMYITTVTCSMPHDKHSHVAGQPHVIVNGG